MATLEDLQNRLEALEDLAAIQALKARYGRLADDRYGESAEEKERLAAEISELFTEDAVWDADGVACAKGRSEIRKLFASPKHRFAIHFFKMIDINVNKDEATASWFYFMPATKKDDTAVWQSGREDELYVKINNKWMIKSLKMTLFFHTAYDDAGWGKKPVISYD
jgi:hypothetical protein